MYVFTNHTIESGHMYYRQARMHSYIHALRVVAYAATLSAMCMYLIPSLSLLTVNRMYTFSNLMITRLHTTAD